MCMRSPPVGSRVMTCRFVSTTEPRVIPHRHAEPCTCDGERGCLSCTEPHCICCGRNHAAAACVECLEAARSDLHAIWDLCGALPDEAVERGVQSTAMTLWGPVADPEAWQHVAMSAIRGRLCRCMQRRQLCPSLFGGKCPDEAYLEDNRDEHHPLFILGGWEQIWRDFLDHYTEEPITVDAAVAYLDMQIGYMATQIEPAFDEFARELRECRNRMEDVLRAGEREERTRVPCLDCATRLVKVYAPKASDDHWSCPHCKRTYNAEEFARARHYQLASEKADRFVKVADAVATVGRPEQTVRTWMRNGQVRITRDADTDAILVWWPDVRTMHISTPTRKRGEIPTYNGMHQRIRRIGGSAAEHVCVDCGEQAAHWSYNHTATDELTSDRGSPYATSLEHYSPRCAACHSRFDGSASA